MRAAKTLRVARSTNAVGYPISCRRSLSARCSRLCAASWPTNPATCFLSSGSVIWPATARTERIMNASPSGKAPESTETT
ncbi:Uncharacterised protein [Mycobacteroides abscessus subsp. abscessus]|nr:Uncharacterised protein [Mycobacteroides abscessus subsp. abscessus]